MVLLPNQRQMMLAESLRQNQAQADQARAYSQSLNSGGAMSSAVANDPRMGMMRQQTGVMGRMGDAVAGAAPMAGGRALPGMRTPNGGWSNAGMNPGAPPMPSKGQGQSLESAIANSGGMAPVRRRAITPNRGA